MVNRLEKSFELYYSACDEIAALVTDFCRNLKMESREAVRYRLAAEECLLYWLEHGCEGANVRLYLGRRLLAPCIILEADGEPLNPYKDESGDFGIYCESILSNLRLKPEYSYENDRNVIRFRIRRKGLGQFAKLGIVIAASILVGLLGQLSLPPCIC